MKLSLARIKKFGQNFEISIDPDAAMKYRAGEVGIDEVLLVDDIFTDAKKGLKATDNELQKVFQTTDTEKIAEIILKSGEIQSTAEQRSGERDQLKKKLIHLIHQQAIDPTTKLPHPVTRIEAALAEGKVPIDYNKSAEDQFDEVVKKLRPIIPISIEMATLTITIPSQYSGKAYNIVSSGSKILKDTWNGDGSWTVSVELPAGMKPDFVEKLNSLTHGEVSIS